MTAPSPAELMNSPGAAWLAAACATDGSAGITPPLARITSALSAPPASTTGTPAIRRLTHAKAPSSA